MLHDQLQIESTNMLDSLGLQLREAEARRADIERAHKETLAQIRNFGVSGKCDNELIENLQSKARELEKKVALETVRCEELQLELSAAMKSKPSRHSTSVPPTSSSSSVTWAPPINQDQNSEVDLIMAKIEQDNRVLAELEEPRTSGSGLAPGSIMSMGSTDYKPLSKNVLSGNSALTGLTMPTNTSSNAANGMSAAGGLLAPNSISVSSSLTSNAVQSLNTSSFPGTSCVDKLLSGTSGMNISSMSPNVYSLKHIPSLSQRGTIQLYNLQSTTMPILSLHNSHPAASSSYNLGLSGISSSYMHPNISSMIDTSAILGNGMSATAGTTGSSIYGLTGVIPGLPSTYSPPFIDSGATSHQYAGTIRNSKPKLLDDVDFSLMRYANRSSPCSPIPPQSTWGFDDYTDNLSTNLMHSQRGMGIGSTLDIETRGHILNGNSEPQVDMLDIPGKGRCCVFIARFPYDPPDS